MGILDKKLDGKSDATTNTANADQPLSGTTTDLDKLTQSQAGDNETTSTTGDNANQAAAASGSATRTGTEDASELNDATLQDLSTQNAKDTADLDLGIKKELGESIDASVGKPTVDGTITTDPSLLLSLDESAIAANEGGASWTSHPTKNLKLGRFQFENSTLSLKGKDVSEFESLLDKQPLYIKNSVRRVDSSVADSIAKKFLDQQKMHRGIDTAGNGPKSGTTGSSL